MHSRSWRAWLRPLTQAAFVVLMLGVALRHHLSALTTASVHAYCPFGVMASIWPLITTGSLAPKLHMSTTVLGVGVLISGALVGSAFCGWVCPLGALQDGLAWLRRKLHIQEVIVPKRLDQVLRYLRYGVLLGIIYATATTATLWFADFDPYYTIFGLDWIFEFDLAGNWPAYLTALAVIGVGLVIPRVWCRYLCPLGGLLSLVQRLSPIKIRRNAGACIDCNRCTRVCPMRLQVATASAVKTDCSMCLKCVDACPAAGALETALPGYEGRDLGKEHAA